MDSMKVGIKYCGGCNPRYDRGQLVEKLKTKYKKFAWENASEEQFYDLLVLVCGCSSCCASYEQYNFKKLLKVWDGSLPEIEEF